MDKKYDIKEILSAVDEFHQIKNVQKTSKNIKNGQIPSDTMKIIEDAEKNLKLS